MGWRDWSTVKRIAEDLHGRPSVTTVLKDPQPSGLCEYVVYIRTYMEPEHSFT